MPAYNLELFKNVGDIVNERWQAVDGVLSCDASDMGELECQTFKYLKALDIIGTCGEPQYIAIVGSLWSDAGVNGDWGHVKAIGDVPKKGKIRVIIFTAQMVRLVFEHTSARSSVA